MGLTSAILTGFTGINSNQFAVETIGNNVANVNTTAFKSVRALFETLPSQTVSDGTAPDADQGGTNPVQFGFGSNLATTQRNFSQGSTERTGVRSDLAIDGGGFFVLESPTEGRVYSRDGAFDLNQDQTLVSAGGSFVQGFAASTDGTINTGQLTNLNIPLGTTSGAGATTQASMIGNLDSQSELATAGSVSLSNAMVTAGGAAATDTTPLTSLVAADGSPLFTTADVITVSDVQKGGIDLPQSQFVVGVDGTTYGDLATFLNTAFGIDTGANGGSPGVVIGDGVSNPQGALVVTSNAGDVNALSLDASSLRNSTTGSAPFAFTTTPAVGDGVTTTFQVYDSLGTPVAVRVRLVPDSRSDGGTVWRYTAESDSAPNRGQAVGSGTVEFDQNGRFISAGGNNFSIDRTDTGAAPLAFTLDFSQVTGLTATDGESTLNLASQDGFPEGTLVDYQIDADGVITGKFSNAQDRVLGQIALATFTNSEGLVGDSENLFLVGVNSGDAAIGTPQTEGRGAVASGQLELSNVDLSRELIGLINASTGFSAAGRTIRTADDMLQEALLLVQ